MFYTNDLNMLLLGRILQAIGAGAGPVISKAIAKESFPPLKLKEHFLTYHQQVR